MDLEPGSPRPELGGGRAQARRIILAQAAVTLGCATGFWLLADTASALAALIGGLINVTANLYFARKLYARRMVKSATETVLGFYVGEVVKLLITTALLALAIGVFKLSFIPLFVTFVATLMVFWVALSPWFDRLFGGRA